MKTNKTNYILRDPSYLTDEYLEKVKDWVSNLLWQDFHDCRYSNDKGKVNTIRIRRKLERVQSLSDVIFFGNAHDMKVIRFGELFICDSKYSKGDLCICKLIKGSKGHKVLHVIAKNNSYENYSQGYFAVPLLD